LTLEELMFVVHVRRDGLSPAEAKLREAEIRVKLFGKPVPVHAGVAAAGEVRLGIHYDVSGRPAICGAESAEYRRFADGQIDGISVEPAIRTKRAE